MKCINRPLVIIVLLALPLFLSAAKLNAREADLSFATLVAANTAKQQCVNACRARYRDCRRLNKLPSSECRGVYQDCTRYSCTGLGPG